MKCANTVRMWFAATAMLAVAALPLCASIPRGWGVSRGGAETACRALLECGDKWESGTGPGSRALYQADQLVPEAYIGTAMGDQWVSDRYQTAANAIAAEFVVGEAVGIFRGTVGNAAESGVLQNANQCWRIPFIHDVSSVAPGGGLRQGCPGG